MKKTFYIENLGCYKNQVDAETAAALLEKEGWLRTDVDSASVLIVNTCGFIDAAKEESIQTLISLRKDHPGKIIIATGCLSQRYGRELEKELTEADGFIGNRDISVIPQAVESIVAKKTKLVSPEKQGEAFFIERKSLFSFPRSVYVKISDGCCNNCSYCAIPLIRGSLKSVPEDIIIREIKSFAEKGFFEINLVAQDSASYGKERGGSLYGLLENISLLKEDFRIRLLYLHPDKFDLSILDLFKKDKRLIPYFDIPFQHSSEKILSAMGRKGNSEKYLALIDTIRKELPDSVIRSSFITGFPGENDRDFEELEDFLQKASLEWCGFFTYSREEGTPAASMKGQVPKAKAEKRKERAAALQTKITEKRLERFIDREIEVLIEEIIKEENIALGRGYFNAPEVDGAVILLSDDISEGKILPGDVVRARIVKRNNIDLEAVPVGS